MPNFSWPKTQFLTTHPSCAQPHIPSTPFASLRLHCAGDSACVRLRAAGLTCEIVGHKIAQHGRKR